MNDSTTKLCAYGAASSACATPAEWLIIVGERDFHLACDEHRNDVLARFEPKDVSGLFPLSALDADELAALG